MIYISYYTKKTPYEEIIKTHLLPSLVKWGLKHDIQAIKDKGSWQLNTGYKSTFIKKMLLKHKQGVIFIDSDAIIERLPVLFQDLNEYDIAFHWLDWFQQWRNQPGKDKKELLSGTMLFNPTEKTFDLLDKWIEEVKNQPGKWEQRVLQEIVEQEKELSIYELPASYCTVILHNGEIPEYIKEPVIVHKQASRKHKT